MMIGRLLWPVALLSAAGAALSAYLWDPPGALRAVVVAGFLLVCPGMAVARLLRLADALAEWLLAVALSVALATLVASATLYAGAWDPGVALVILAGVCALGALLQLVQEARALSTRGAA